MDENVKASIVLKEGQQLTPQEMLAYCDQHLPAFAVPRFIEFLDELPRTPGTEKVQRYKLRERGTREAWDSQRR
jgi:carnitine-CoA ligase